MRSRSDMKPLVIVSDHPYNSTSFSTNISVVPSVWGLPVAAMYMDVYDPSFTVFSAFLVVSVCLCVPSLCNSLSKFEPSAFTKSLYVTTGLEFILMPLLIATMVNKQLCFERLNCQVVVFLPTATRLCGLCFHLFAALRSKMCCYCGKRSSVFMSLTVWIGTIVLFSVAPSYNDVTLILSCVLAGLTLSVATYAKMTLLSSPKRYKPLGIYVLRAAFFIVLFTYTPYSVWLGVQISNYGNPTLYLYLMGVCIFSLRTLVDPVIYVRLHEERREVEERIELSHMPRPQINIFIIPTDHRESPFYSQYRDRAIRHSQSRRQRHQHPFSYPALTY